MYKFIFFTPLESAESVKNAVFETGAGSIGNYKKCSFESEGTGQFLPVEGASPSLGKVDSLEKVRELRVEILCSEEQLSKAIRAMIKAHPYEDPAWEVVRLENERLLKMIQD